jgi:hypothetical protein
MATLNLPTSAPAAVWRLVKARLKADPALDAAGVRLLFFEGDRDPTADVASLPGPAVVFVAGLGGLSWWTERAQAGSLLVTYQAALDGLDDEDPLNLEWAIEAALYPDDGFAFHQSLIEAGAVTGQPEFGQPLNLQPSDAGRAGRFTPAGQFAVKVERGFAP